MILDKFNQLINTIKNQGIDSLSNEYVLEIDCLKVGNKRFTIKAQTQIVKELGIIKDQTISTTIGQDVYSIYYNNSILYITKAAPKLSIDYNLTNRINTSPKGVILTNDYKQFKNEHITALVATLDNTFTMYKDYEQALESATHVIVENFDFSAESYEAVSDLLSQGKIVIITVPKYNIYDVISSFTDLMPIQYRMSIVSNIIAAYIYYIMPVSKEVINEYVIGVSVLKNDIIKGKFTQATLNEANSIFKEEIKSGILYNAKDGSKERLDEILSEAIRLGASDISLSNNLKPMLRISKQLVPLASSITLSAEVLYSFSQIILKTDEVKQIFEEEDQVNYAYTLGDLGRFRVSLYKQRGTVAVSFRYIEENAWTVEKTGIPQHILSLFDLKSSEKSKARGFKDGLIMITGSVNTGKSTTMNALINYINENKAYKIITVEDPIEVVHKSKRSLIEQRDIGVDCASFEDGLAQGLRSDPDVISVGEMRTSQAADTILKAARSGHLAFSTFHTPSAVQTIQSFLQMFPEASRPLVRTMLAESLRMIYSQKLLPKKGGGLIAAQEILLNTDAVRATIANESSKLSGLTNTIMSGAADGMISMDRSIANLYRDGKIELEVALANAVDLQALKSYIGA